MIPNTLYPGRPNYTGPKEGWFALLHHEVLFEQSHNVMERVEYVKQHKPENEVDIRLHNMLALPAKLCSKLDALSADYYSKLGALSADYRSKRDYNSKRRALLYADYDSKRRALYADYNSKRDALDADYDSKLDALNAEILVYIRKYIPDCAWNGETLVFTKGTK